MGLQGRRADRDLAGDRRRRGLHRQHERPPVRDRPADRQGEVELQVAHADRVVAGGRGRHGVLRLLGGLARRHRRRDRPAALGVRGRVRAQVRGEEPARLPVGRADDSRRLGRLHLVARGRGRQGVFRQRRRQRLRGGREERRAAVEVPDRRRRARLARGRERHGVHRQLGRLPVRHRRGKRTAEVDLPRRPGSRRSTTRSDSSPRPPSSTARCTWAAATRTSTRSTPQPAARSGTTRPASRG